MPRKKIGRIGYLHYDPKRKSVIIVTDDVKKRLQELKTKYRLKSFNEVIELLLDEKKKKHDRNLGELTQLSYETAGYPKKVDLPKSYYLKNKKKKKNILSEKETEWLKNKQKWRTMRQNLKRRRK